MAGSRISSGTGKCFVCHATGHSQAGPTLCGHQRARFYSMARTRMKCRNLLDAVQVDILAEFIQVTSC
ncbi:hypothetical protein AY555_01505 [Haematospirillum jordaniae]|uniref:Uncharacterized protein n=1 Tax=Haematospirillum jordaniae TaxID=1549855 RepID=A0A143DBP3_9PROT|nr:hypothetical protein AY555_01505 [Haematospirillum jordaniae]